MAAPLWLCVCVGVCTCMHLLYAWLDNNMFLNHWIRWIYIVWRRLGYCASVINCFDVNPRLVWNPWPALSFRVTGRWEPKNGDSQTKLSLSLSAVQRRLSVSPNSASEPRTGEGLEVWRSGGGVKRLIVSGSLLFVEAPPRLGTTGFCQTTALSERPETRASVWPP